MDGELSDVRVLDWIERQNLITVNAGFGIFVWFFNMYAINNEKTK